jgi:hypothetical protein
MDKREAKTRHELELLDLKLNDFGEAAEDLCPLMDSLEDSSMTAGRFTPEALSERLIALAQHILEGEEKFKKVRLNLALDKIAVVNTSEDVGFWKVKFERMWGAVGEFEAVDAYDKQRFFGSARKRMEESKASKPQ